MAKKLKKRAVGRPFLLRDTEEVYAERWAILCDVMAIIPGAETILGEKGEGTLRWWANPRREDWGKVVLNVNLNHPVEGTIETLKMELGRERFPPEGWDYWKEFGIEPTLDREVILKRYHELPATSEVQIAYGRILSELWAKGAYKKRRML